MSKEIKFRIKELIAEKERKTGDNITYLDIFEKTKDSSGKKGVSPNTISALVTGKAKMVGISTVERLLDYFECEPGDLIVYE